MIKKKNGIVEEVIDSIYRMSDSEILSESKEIYENFEERLSSARAAIQNAVDKFDSSLSSKTISPLARAADLMKMSIAEKKFALVQIFQQQPGLTAHFRDFEDLSESEIDYLIEDLKDYGVLS